ncbi:aldo/keto reductase [Streptomyces abyssomicinicus]|uniref:aldo/keto reductase n=1 Tax=Streptomyces abyssomicinicus TaxID=574929 RepID=UPI001C3FDEDD|nr:aldo/keto reductase [Streptomyces abyssomicinicus]
MIPIPRKTLGALTVGAQGLGCLGMSEFYGPTDEAEAIATVHRALELGVTVLDTADVYGLGANEELLGRALSGARRDQAVIVTKGGVVRPDGRVGRGVRGDAPYLRAACEASLRRLGTDRIDLYLLARVDPAVPVEDSVGALADLVAEGKVRHIGLSEAAAGTIRRAHAVHPLTAVEMEWSLFSREVEEKVLPLCRAEGIGVLAYAPLARGLMTGQLRSLAQFDARDFRRIAQPRFADGNLTRNLVLVDALADLARVSGLTPAQLALAWLHHRGPDVVPIPGTRHRAHLTENAAATALALSPEELAAVERAVPAGAAAGERYVPTSMAMVGL